MESYHHLYNTSRLLIKYWENSLSEEEQIALEAWIAENPLLFEELSKEEVLKVEMKKMGEYHPQQAWDRIEGELMVKRMVPWGRMAAAMLLLVLAIGAKWWYTSHVEPPMPEIAKAQHTKGQPVLIMGNGEEVVLQARDTLLKEQGGATIRQQGNKLAYGDTTGPMVYNTLQIPRGMNYNLTLSDGTEVWLNAESSLRFPVHFTGKERKVYLTGEAYFSVATNAAKPFSVFTEQMEVAVLGTEFNVMAYTNEPAVQLALVSGSVKVKAGGKETILQPGWVGICSKENITTQQMDITALTGWKRGMFVFRNDDITTVMHQLERWYDVTAVYPKGKPANQHFTGAIVRYDSIEKVLEMLNQTGGANFKLRGKQINVDF
ncbi:FecR family protein [Chitinophaga arvensicola]|uniref:FecR protein n=1 Tax=Chitinophaga arvensicola TaxID=29529 RepID=A0A1I0PT14_9BACT|nr:FecR domain-containing protein [Chitinophaga arvensicola]SEW17444.1 FecR protein [Chitinophaga arvensicola]